MFARKKQMPVELTIKRLVLYLVVYCIITHTDVVFESRVYASDHISAAQRIETQDTGMRDKRHELAMKSSAEGEKLWAQWKEQSLREAIGKYTDASLYWQSIGSQRETAVALEAAGELHFILSEYHQALDSYDQALTIRRTLMDEPGIIRTLNNIGYTYIYLGQNQRALSYLRQAMAHLHKLRSLDGNNERVRREAQLLNSLGEVYYSLSEVKKALDSFRRSLTLWTTVGDPEGEALAHLNIGYMYYDFGDLKGAYEHYDRSLSLWVAAGNKRGEALSRTAIGGIHSFLGEQQAALDSHNEALNLFRSIGDRYGEAATLNGIGTAYEGLNKTQEALDNYDRAMRLYRSIGNRDFDALAKFYLGAVHRATGAIEKALDYYNQSLSLLRKVGNRRLETYVLKDMAIIYSSSGQIQRALNQYERVLKLYHRFEDQRGQANTLNSIGDIYYSSGQAHKALGFYNQALALSQAAQDRGSEIRTLYDLARAERDVGDTSQALSRMDASLKLIEGLRIKAGSPDLRASYFASVHQHYELYVDLLMDMHKRHPEEDFASKALYTSERSRARSLLEMLGEAKVDIRRGADPVLVERADSLERLLDAKAEYQMRVLSAKHTKDDVAEIDKEIRELVAEYDEVTAQIREQSSLYVTLTEPKLLHLKDIQAELKDKDTLLLEYALGEARSYLWAITSESFTSYELSGRSILEDAAGEVYRLLIARQPLKGESQEQYEERVATSDRQYWPQVLALSQTLLGKAANQLGKKRLIIVSEGALQYIPFEALPVASSDRREQESNFASNFNSPENIATLVTAHEIVYLQSASMLTALRQEKSLPESNRKGVAVLADPVFEKDDPRVHLEARPEASLEIPETAQRQRSLRDIGDQNGGLNLSRLPSTLQEAQMIVKAAPYGTTRVALGFQANKTAVMSAEFSQYKVLHFATHGIIHNEHPDLSGIVLSLVDQKGNAQSGFLRLPDIYKLNLAADLVVLSACQSAIGKHISGEGFVGLTRGFMYAGSRSVVASLWKVDDEATAELMSHFYQAMLREGLPPAAALQKAKQAMQAHPKWHHPFYWAAFVLQGEYREGIKIDSAGGVDVLLIGALVVALSAVGFYVVKRTNTL